MGRFFPPSLGGAGGGIMSMDKVIEKKKGLRRKHIIWIVAGLAFAFLLYKVIFTEQGSVFRAEKDKLTISAVESGIFNDYITVIGQVDQLQPFFLMLKKVEKWKKID